jgi:hypothetical protein
VAKSGSWPQRTTEWNSVFVLPLVATRTVVTCLPQPLSRSSAQESSPLVFACRGVSESRDVATSSPSCWHSANLAKRSESPLLVGELVGVHS